MSLTIRRSCLALGLIPGLIGFACVLRGQQPAPPPLAPPTTQGPVPPVAIAAQPPPPTAPAAPLVNRKPLVYFVPDYKKESELLPAATTTAAWRLRDTIEQVPELALVSPGQLGKTGPEAEKQIAMRLSQIRYLDGRSPHGFLTAVAEHRPDLGGLPYLRGPACRMTDEIRGSFAEELAGARQALGTTPANVNFATLNGGRINATGLGQPGGTTGAATFTRLFVDSNIMTGSDLLFSSTSIPAFARSTRDVKTGKVPASDPLAVKTDAALLARTRANMQILCAPSAEARMALVQELQNIPHRETTTCLAKMAIFSPEASVRQAATMALALRRENDYDDALLAGFRYPLPTVADHAAEAIVRLKRTDLLERIVDVLDQPDPREPTPPACEEPARAREVVKLNHHRNCMLCHAPHPAEVSAPDEQVFAIPSDLAPLMARLPNPHEPFPSSGGYDPTPTVASFPDQAIRIDVTYLRQDFSLMQPVKAASPWPDQQRFDYLVNRRDLTAAEWEAFQAEVKARPAGYIAPHHRAALRVLRTLTGLDAAPTAAAWRPLVRQALATTGS